MQGVPGTRELQNPLPHPPELGTVLPQVGTSTKIGINKQKKYSLVSSRAVADEDE